MSTTFEQDSRKSVQQAASELRGTTSTSGNGPKENTRNLEMIFGRSSDSFVSTAKVNLASTLVKG